MIDLARKIATLGFVFAVYFFILRKKPYYGIKLYPLYWYRTAKAEGWKRILRVLLLSIPIIILLYFLLPIINNFAESLVGGVPSVEPGRNPIATMVGISPYLLLFASIFVPIIEEWLCRYVLLEEFRAKWGVKWAVFLSASVFALLHLTNRGFALHSTLVPFIAGLIYAGMYLKWGLKAAVFAHSGNNAFRTLLWMLGFE